MFTILTKSNKTFRGPFTDDPAAGNGETRIVLTEGQLSGLATVRAQSNPFGVYLFFDAGAFRQSTLDESSVVAPTLRLGLIYLFRKVSSTMDRAKLYPLYITLSGLFDAFGENGGTIKTDIRTMIQDALADEDSDELKAIQAQMLALPQWN